MGFHVHVVAASPDLRKGLIAGLHGLKKVEAQAHRLNPADVGSSHVVVSTVADCPPEYCAELSDTGAAVIVLAAIPRERERERYKNAGAKAYLPMALGSGDLIRAISEIDANAPQGPPPDDSPV